MEFPPVGTEEIGALFRLAKPAVDIVTRLYRMFKEPDERIKKTVLGNIPSPDNDDPGENRDRKDCIKEAILILTQETQGKKSSHLEKFVENTLFNPKCELTSSTIFYFLQDIKQMTWRQLCLLEGFRRENNREIEIRGPSDSDINAISIGTEIKKLMDLNYLYERGTSQSSSSKSIRVDELGIEISKLLDLESIDLPEIGKAFGKGSIKTEVTY